MNKIFSEKIPQRLYRGIKHKYNPDKVSPEFIEANFTDCVYTALSYARSRYGEVLVLDIPQDCQSSVSRADWLRDDAGRFIVCGKFDKFISAIIPAKELRSIVRKKGVVTLPDDYKSVLLEEAVEDALEKAPKTDRPIKTIKSREISEYNLLNLHKYF